MKKLVNLVLALTLSASLLSTVTSAKAAESLNWENQNGLWYVIDDSGKTIKGWIASGADWYYMNPENGAMQVGWQTINDKQYYFDSQGRMIKGAYTIDGKIELFNHEGVWYSYPYLKKPTGFVEFDIYLENLFESLLTHNMSEQEIIGAIYDYVRNKYSYVSYDSGDYYLNKELIDFYRENYRPLSAEHRKFKSINSINILYPFKTEGNCVTHAELFQLLVASLGYEERTVLGKVGGEGHLWNEIKLSDGNYYFIDTTFGANNRNGYFLLNKEPSNYEVTRKNNKYDGIETPELVKSKEELIDGIFDGLKLFIELTNENNNISAEEWNFLLFFYQNPLYNLSYTDYPRYKCNVLFEGGNPEITIKEVKDLLSAKIQQYLKEKKIRNQYDFEIGSYKECYVGDSSMICYEGEFRVKDDDDILIHKSNPYDYEALEFGIHISKK